jgi:hypothetical protein
LSLAILLIITYLDFSFNDTDDKFYYPIIFQNDFWLLNEELIEINETLCQDNNNEILYLDITYDPIGLMKWSFLTQMDESLSQQDVYSYTLLNP